METKRSTFATSFYIKRSAVRNRDGKAPIMVKISVDGDDKAVGTKLFVTPDLWENGKAKGKSAEANEINGQLKEVSARLTNHYHRILREEDFVTAEKLRNAFLGVGVMENCILKDFGNMNREFGAMVEKGQRAKSTYNKYLAVYNHFKTFLWEKKKRTDMAYKELTKEIITDFDKYLRVEKGLSANTLWIYTTRRGGVESSAPTPSASTALRCRRPTGAISRRRSCAPWLTPCSSRNRPASCGTCSSSGVSPGLATLT